MDIETHGIYDRHSHAGGIYKCDPDTFYCYLSVGIIGLIELYSHQVVDNRISNYDFQ